MKIWLWSFYLYENINFVRISFTKLTSNYEDDFTI